MSLAIFSVNYKRDPTDCLKREIFDDDDLSMHRFNGSLRMLSEFSGPPSQRIDEAWEEITYAKGGLMRISKDQLGKINASFDAAEYTEKMGGGYLAAFEVFHELHCVNMLRQATYMDHYLPKNREWGEDPETLRYHLGQYHQYGVKRAALTEVQTTA